MAVRRLREQGRERTEAWKVKRQSVVEAERLSVSKSRTFAFTDDVSRAESR